MCLCPGYLLCQLLGVLAGDDRQDEEVGNGVGLLGVLLEGLLQGGLGLLETAEVQLADGLGDEAPGRRGGGGLGELLEDVERLLVLFTTLFVSMLVPRKTLLYHSRE